ncbi:MAG: TA system VapC family ribonuclease toxin [Bryobacteraceae bacterium]
MGNWAVSSCGLRDPAADANVLIAMGMPEHLHHVPARRWFLERRHEGWATCPVTQSAFVRVSCRVTAGALRTPAIAIEFLRAATADRHHSFWPMEQPMTDLGPEIRKLLIGSKQVTDLILLDLALKHNGSLATFDARLVKSVAGSPRLAGAVELVPST